MEIYDRLLQFTLFQGMSLADLMQVAGHTKFGFSKLVSGKRLVREGDPCTHLIFLTSGTLRVDTLSDDYTCRVSETVSAPYIIQPERIFGINRATRRPSVPRRPATSSPSTNRKYSCCLRPNSCSVSTCSV